MDYSFYDVGGQLSLLEPPEEGEGKAYHSRPKRQVDVEELVAAPYQHLDLTPGHGDLLGDARWEWRSPILEDGFVLNTGLAPREPIRSSLTEILEDDPDHRYDLTKIACLGILRRAKERGKELPPPLKRALMIQAGSIPYDGCVTDLKAYHINQRDEGIDLDCVAGALMATNNMQMQTFITQGHTAFAQNQRDEVRDLHGVAGALAARPGMKQQTFVATFNAGAGASAGGIGYHESIAPTLKAAQSGNMVPSVLCLNDQGGGVMDCTEDMTGTLRAQQHGHQPLVFENYGIDTRYRGPLPVAPTLSARAGTGGNNLPLVANDELDAICITGNAIDRQPENGGNGLGVSEDSVAFTLTATDRHAVFSRQRVDVFKEGDVASTQSARQHKDATDLVYQETVGALTSSDRKGPNSQYVSQDKLVAAAPRLIRRLTPLECERLQGFPDGWTDIPGASDTARYKALGNSVAIPCVEFIMDGIARAQAGAA